MQYWEMMILHGLREPRQGRDMYSGRSEMQTISRIVLLELVQPFLIFERIDNFEWKSPCPAQL